MLQTVVLFYISYRLYQSLKKPINTLVFQDLGALGFGLASRELGMDETHAALVLKRLAQFHSISVMVNQKVSLIRKKTYTYVQTPLGVIGQLRLKVCWNKIS